MSLEITFTILTLIITTTAACTYTMWKLFTNNKPPIAPNTSQSPIHSSIRAENGKMGELNERFIDTVDIKRIMKYGSPQNNILNPFVICLSTKLNKCVFENERDQIELEKQYNFALVNGKTHRELKKQLTDIVHNKYADNEDKFDGIIVVLLCIIHDAQFNWFYDQNMERRHIEKLSKDIKYRIDGNVDFNYNNVLLLNQW